MGICIGRQWILPHKVPVRHSFDGIMAFAWIGSRKKKESNGRCYEIPSPSCDVTLAFMQLYDALVRDITALKPEVPCDIVLSRQKCWMPSTDQKVTGMIDSQTKCKGNIYNFSVSSAYADNLASLCSRGAVMAKIGPYIYIYIYIWRTDTGYVYMYYSSFMKVTAI